MAWTWTTSPFSFFLLVFSLVRIYMRSIYMWWIILLGVLAFHKTGTFNPFYAQQLLHAKSGFTLNPPHSVHKIYILHIYVIRMIATTETHDILAQN